MAVSRKAAHKFGDMGEVYVLRGMKVSVFTKGEERHAPHFHVYYRSGPRGGLGQGAQIDIESGEVVAGELPASVKLQVLKWLAQPGVREALRENWNRARAGQATFRIATT